MENRSFGERRSEEEEEEEEEEEGVTRVRGTVVNLESYSGIKLNKTNTNTNVFMWD